ncbi:hypothetical protein [Ferrimonas sp. YFM]|uniref:hypothetical protein n=1 Tax=Ferrimonas sp. YFM TaxID=3028878 RepID=UPI002572277B|nr:hypothetical protein [Ferrimonas sp. YFM]BDY05750.1 hypothetical protein F0521_27910 [Ferrimonas sp. YFM]
MNSQNDELYELTSESNFWKLYKLLRVIKTSTDTKVAFACSFMLMVWFNLNSNGSVSYISSEIQEVSGNIIGWSVSIVGFILAGYSIYSTLSDKEFQYSMSKFQDENYEISHLKSSHCVFIKVVVDIISIVMITYLYSLFLKTEIPEKTSTIVIFGESAYKLYLCLTLSLLQAFFVLILMMCKSFIYNVYHSIMTSIRWYGENECEEEPAKIVERVAFTVDNEIVLELVSNDRRFWRPLTEIEENNITIYMTGDAFNQIKHMKKKINERSEVT